jgi:hypothetical protein
MSSEPSIFNSEEQPEGATEKEETDFKTYQRHLNKQKPIVDSYEKLLEVKEIAEKKSHIDKLNNKIGTKIFNLTSQSGGQDRLKLTKDFYQQTWEGIKTDTLFLGDVKKQYRLLELLAAQEYEIKPAKEVRALLEEEFKDIL